jgi:hypothetical protein
MATRQSCCEFEIVPSLHLNLRGASTDIGRFAAATVCGGSGASAADLGESAQPPHKSKIKKTKANRIRASSSIESNPDASFLPPNDTTGPI